MIFLDEPFATITTIMDARFVLKKIKNQFINNVVRSGTSALKPMLNHVGSTISFANISFFLLNLHLVGPTYMASPRIYIKRILHSLLNKRKFVESNICKIFLNF